MRIRRSDPETVARLACAMLVRRVDGRAAAARMREFADAMDERDAAPFLDLADLLEEHDSVHRAASVSLHSPSAPYRTPALAGG